MPTADCDAEPSKVTCWFTSAWRGALDRSLRRHGIHRRLDIIGGTGVVLVGGVDMKNRTSFTVVVMRSRVSLTVKVAAWLSQVRKVDSCSA